MSKTIRIAYPGAYYHIINRGNDQQNIYYREQDKQHFISLIGEMCLKYDVEVHAYCLMDDHFHLTIRTVDANISRAIHYLESAYVNRMNVEVKREGPFFEGRFKAILVDSDQYLSHLTRHIHRDPVRAGLVRTPQQYPWSSYAAYIGIDEPPEWLVVAEVLKQFSDNPQAYKRFVEGGQCSGLTNFFANHQLPLLLGTDAFRKQVVKLIGRLPKPKRDSLKRFLKARYSFNQIIDSVVICLKINRESLFEILPRRHNVGRLIFIYLCKEKSGLGNRKIADFLGLKSEAAIPLAVKRLRVLMSRDQKVVSLINSCLSHLNAKEPNNMHDVFQASEENVD